MAVHLSGIANRFSRVGFLLFLDEEMHSTAGLHDQFM